MKLAYVLEVQGAEDRDNAPIFQKINDLDMEDRQVFFDMAGEPQGELQRLLGQVQPKDILYVRSILDLSDGLDGAIEILSILSQKGVVLHSCMEPYLCGDGYLQEGNDISQEQRDGIVRTMAAWRICPRITLPSISVPTKLKQRQ